MRSAYCSGCMANQPVDENWRALWIDSDGDLRITALERSGDIDFERPGTVFACGQGSALALTERYLHSRSFTLAHDTEIAIAEAARVPGSLFDELT